MHDKALSLAFPLTLDLFFSSHLDHCGALPYFTELCGYQGPIYMTYPTKAICPILLEDYRKIMVEKKGDTGFFTLQNIKNCMKKGKTGLLISFLAKAHHVYASHCDQSFRNRPCGCGIGNSCLLCWPCKTDAISIYPTTLLMFAYC